MGCMNKMKVLFLIDTLTGGGAETVLRTLVNHLDPEKFDITVQTVTYTDPSAYLKPHIRYRAINRRNSPVFHLWLRWAAQLGWAYRKYIRGDYYLEVAFLECGPTKLLAQSMNSKAAKLAWVHCDLEQKQLPKHYYRLYEKFDRVVCVSENVRDSFTRLSGIRADVLENVIDEEEILEKSREFIPQKSELFTLCAVGRLSREKGFDRLVEAAERLRREGFAFQLQILGDGPERTELERAGAAEFLGVQENPYPYMASADAIVIPSRTEGRSTVGVEALILGRPILATDCPGMDTLLGAAGLLTQNSTEGIYLGMRRLLQDAALRERLSAAAARRGKAFSKAETLRRTESYFLECLEEKWGKPWTFT